MKINNILATAITKIHTAHKSNEMKEYEISKLIDFEEDEELKNGIKQYWNSFNKPKTQIVQIQTIKPISEWTSNNLQLDTRGNIMTNNSTNLFTILTEHPKFNNRLSFNELTSQYCYDGKEIHDLDYTQLQLDICTELRINFKKTDVCAMAELIAKKNPFHPIKNYLTGVKWDQQDYLSIFLKAMNIESNDINLSVFKCWLISAVARIMKPGCKVDSIPVFQGTTGNRKSSALKALMPNEEWFTDEPVDFGTKDSKQMLLGKWFVELAELSSFNKKDNNLIKSNITQTVDEFRSPYDRKPKKYPRQFVYIGTTNDAEFLTDSTSNRRFWVLQNEGLIDVDLIKEVRDQLWAQAYSLFINGEKWWLTRDQEQSMAEIAAQFEVKDAWYDSVVVYLEDKKFVTTSEILMNLKGDLSRTDNNDKNRVVKIMQYLKWTARAGRKDGDCVSGWHNPKSIKGKELSAEISDWN